MYLCGSCKSNWVRISWRTRRVALAVNAAIGLSGKFARRLLNCRYSGRNSWPHSEMQCASSMAKNAIGTRESHAIVSGLAKRSGERYSRRYAPCAAREMTLDCSDQGTELFKTAAGMPMSESWAAWSCINAINGEMTIAVPLETKAGNW